MIDLRHYSSRPIKTLHDVVQQRRPFWHKPSGLWLSVGVEWRDWCDEGFNVEDLAIETWVDVDVTNFVVVTDAPQLDAFTERWCDREERERMIRGIRWDRVAEEYDGIIIAPYVHACRFSHHWYYGWDVASACVWRARAIRSFGPMVDSDMEQHL